MTCIDFWGAVMAGMSESSSHFIHLDLILRIDYQTFANSEPEMLAQAIAKGIPNTLRGMMWQLM